MSAPDFNYMEFEPVEHTSGLWVRCKYGEGKIETTGAEGEWEEVKRPYQPTLTIWRGPKGPYKHKIPLLLDGWFDHGREVQTGDHVKSVEQACREVNAMAGIEFSTDRLTEPPLLYIDGYGALPNDYTNNPGLSWVISDLEWGEAVRANHHVRGASAGERIRQAFVVTFAVFQAGPETRRLSNKSKSHRHRVKTRNNDTFEKVAARSRRHGGLGHHEWGTYLARLNGSKKANEKVRHQYIELPTKHEEREWARGKGPTRG